MPPALRLRLSFANAQTTIDILCIYLLNLTEHFKTSKLLDCRFRFSTSAGALTVDDLIFDISDWDQELDSRLWWLHGLESIEWCESRFSCIRTNLVDQSDGRGHQQYRFRPGLQLCLTWLITERCISSLRHVGDMGCILWPSKLVWCRSARSHPIAEKTCVINFSSNIDLISSWG